MAVAKAGSGSTKNNGYSNENYCDNSNGSRKEGSTDCSNVMIN